MSSTPACTSPCEILKLAVPSNPKQRRAPSAARSLARTAATVELLPKFTNRPRLTLYPAHNNIENITHDKRPSVRTRHGEDRHHGQEICARPDRGNARLLTELGSGSHPARRHGVCGEDHLLARL